MIIIDHNSSLFSAFFLMIDQLELTLCNSYYLFKDLKNWIYDLKKVILIFKFANEFAY